MNRMDWEILSVQGSARMENRHGVMAQWEKMERLGNCERKPIEEIDRKGAGRKRSGKNIGIKKWTREILRKKGLTVERESSIM